MTQNNLIKILQTLTRKEMTRFRDFAQSPYHNKHGDTRRLVEYLSAIYPDFSPSKTRREAVFQKIFPGQRFQNRKLAPVFTYARRLLEQFLSVEQLAITDTAADLFLLRQLRARRLYNLYEKKMAGLAPKAVAATEKTENPAAVAFEIAREKDQYFNQLYRTEFNRNLEEKQYWLDRFYLSEKLKDACELKFRGQILQLSGDLELSEEVLQLVGKHPEKFSDTPQIIVYFNIYKTLNANNLSQYFETMTLFKKHESGFSKPELQNIYNYFQNYCIRRINEGDERFLAELFKIYQSQLEQGLLLVEDYLPEWHYKNIVTTGLRLGENDWVRDFIESWKGRLNPVIVENAYSYNLASYYYATRQYGRVLDLLVRVEYTDIRYNLGAKSLLLKTYFDLDEEEAFYSLTEAFQKFLKRNRLISDFQKAGYYN
ncbi:MAG: hypothetical protein D6714_10245, partial [Bacteroidetes bacterium]